MKKTLFILAFMVAIAANAQNSGLGFNYQAVVRNVNGVLLADSDVNLRVSLYPGQYAIVPTWVETHQVHTDYSGCFGITVGKGERDNNSIVQSYSDVNFSGIYYWWKIEILEGNSYREINYSQLPSAPYAEVAYNAMIPAGVIVPYGGENIPAGWLLCDGSPVSRSTYSKLYEAIGVCWGIGDGATTFNLPDMRGMFLRGVSGQSGNDYDANYRIMLNGNGGNTGNNVGSFQDDAIRNITGNTGVFDTWGVPTASGAFTFIQSNGLPTSAGAYATAGSFDFDASRVVPVGSDNRPKNVNVNYIIKY